jgi:hypothetical protein
MVQNSEHFCPLRNGSEWNSENFLFRGTDGIPPEQTHCSIYSVFRGIIFLSEIANRTTRSPRPCMACTCHCVNNHFKTVRALLLLLSFFLCFCIASGRFVVCFVVAPAPATAKPTCTKVLRRLSRQNAPHFCSLRKFDRSGNFTYISPFALEYSSSSRPQVQI